MNTFLDAQLCSERTVGVMNLRRHIDITPSIHARIELRGLIEHHFAHYPNPQYNAAKRKSRNARSSHPWLCI